MHLSIKSYAYLFDTTNLLKNYVVYSYPPNYNTQYAHILIAYYKGEDSCQQSIINVSSRSSGVTNSGSTVITQGMYGQVKKDINIYNPDNGSTTYEKWELMYANINGCQYGDLQNYADFFVLNNSIKVIPNKTKIYPNPSRDEFHIITEDSKITRICVYNLYGQKIIDKKLSTMNTNINLDEFPSGIYVLQIHLTNFIETLKIEKL